MKTAPHPPDAEVPQVVVDLRLWSVPRRAVPLALVNMAWQRIPLRTSGTLRFAKLLGTGSGDSFTVRDADVRRWGLLTVFAADADADAFSRHSIISSWSALAEESVTIRMTPLSGHGRWAGREPFPHGTPHRWRGPVAAITRARIRPSQWRAFWASVPPVAADLASRPGLLLRTGIGEAPVGLQGTFSLWADNAALTEFARRGPAHRHAVELTERHRWFSEELFVRFAVHRAAGMWHGAPIELPAVSRSADGGNGS